MAADARSAAPAPASGAPALYGPPILLAQAKAVMGAAEKEAHANAWPMVIAIVDSGGHLVLLQRLDQAQLGSIAIAQAKAETALRFRRPTRDLQDAIAFVRAMKIEQPLQYQNFRD